MTKCIKCEIELDYNCTGIQKVSDGYMCDDCYYSELGEIIEEYPIVNPDK